MRTHIRYVGSPIISPVCCAAIGMYRPMWSRSVTQATTSCGCVSHPISTMISRDRQVIVAVPKMVGSGPNSVSMYVWERNDQPRNVSARDSNDVQMPTWDAKILGEDVYLFNFGQTTLDERVAQCGAKLTNNHDLFVFVYSIVCMFVFVCARAFEIDLKASRRVVA